MPEYVGYHGTSNYAAEKIIERQSFLPSENGWLGCGVYFFPYPDDAEWWCRCNKKLEAGQYKILESKLSPNEVIDLLASRTDMEIFREFCDRVKNRRVKTLNREARNTDISMAIKWMVSEFKKSGKLVDMIIAGFDENRKRWYAPNSREAKQLFNMTVTQIQYCVKNVDCTKAISKYEGE